MTSKLSALHQSLACSEYLRAAVRVVLPADRVPQPDEVSQVLTETCGFRLYPAEGIVAARKFYGEFVDHGFFATQYLRSPEAPFHSPEPDIIHELVGHAVISPARLTGVVREDGELRAYGAAILSSVAELESFRHVELPDFSVADVIRQEYSDKECQPVLFVADSIAQLTSEIGRFLDSVE